MCGIARFSHRKECPAYCKMLCNIYPRKFFRRPMIFLFVNVKMSWKLSFFFFYAISLKQCLNQFCKEFGKKFRILSNGCSKKKKKSRISINYSWENITNFVKKIMGTNREFCRSIAQNWLQILPFGGAKLLLFLAIFRNG